jgi:hypothetical protein
VSSHRSEALTAAANTQMGQSGCMPALYYRGPSEPGGDDDIIAEVVDGKLRRQIEISNGVAHCTGYDDYPVTIDMSAVADYVWPISEQEFNDAWLRYCSGRERGAALRQPRRAGRRGDRRR